MSATRSTQSAVYALDLAHSLEPLDMKVVQFALRQHISTQKFYTAEVDPKDLAS